MSWKEKLKCVASQRSLTANGVNCEIVEMDFDGAADELKIKERLSDCFVDPEHLKIMATQLNISEEEVLKSKLLPTDNKIVSGDFGEILFQFIFEHLQGFDFFHYRWRHKYTRNESVRGSDLIGCLFKNANRSPSSNDRLLVIEVKCGWGGRKSSIVEEAYRGMESDKNGRIGSSLFAILRRRTQENLQADVSDIQRFMDSQKRPFKTTMIVAIGKAKDKWEDAFLEKANPGKEPPDQALVILFENPWEKVVSLLKGVE